MSAAPAAPRRPIGWARARTWRPAALTAVKGELARVSPPIVLAGILADHDPTAARALLADIDLRAGACASPAVARALIAALRHDGFPVLPEDYLDQCDEYAGADCAPMYCTHVPLGSGETYWEVWARDDRSLPEALIAGIADNWTEGWNARAALVVDARGAGEDVASAVDRILELEGRAGPAAAVALVDDIGGRLATLPPPLRALPHMAAFARGATGNCFLDRDDEYWNAQIGREEWRWSVRLVRSLRREWADALAVLTVVEEVSRALEDRACWPRVLAAVADTLAAAPPSRR
jgi:hypothetical protein